MAEVTSQKLVLTGKFCWSPWFQNGFLQFSWGVLSRIGLYRYRLNLIELIQIIAGQKVAKAVEVCRFFFLKENVGVRWG